MAERRRIKLGIRERLTLLFFLVPAIALSINYLTVVPRLESQLRNDDVKALQRVAMQTSETLAQYTLLGQADVTIGFGGDAASRAADARVTIYNLDPTTSPQAPGVQLLFDSTSLRTSSAIPITAAEQKKVPGAALAASAIQRGRENAWVNTIEERDGHVYAESARALFFNGQPVRAVVYSNSLDDVTQSVRRIRARHLFAGGIALLVALLAGSLAARYIARRVRRLERAARLVAAGNFTEPIPVDSDDELGNLAQAFNEMQERLGRSDTARKAFIANASHELRTPLFSLGGYIELMQEEDLDAETTREFLAIMHRQIDRLTKLATDLLDLSRLDTGSFEIRPEHVELAELLRSIAKEFEPAAAQHDSALSIEIPEVDVEAFCDPERVAQIVRILLDNALSHTPPGTAITLRAARVDNEVSITVTDNGPGIKPEIMPRVFERFHTGDRAGGTGLGLSIGRELATAMGSTLDVYSEPGRTVFDLRLPGVTRAGSEASRS